MDVFDKKLWDANTINANDAFITQEVFEKYSITQNFKQKLLRQKRLIYEQTHALPSESSSVPKGDNGAGDLHTVNETKSKQPAQNVTHGKQGQLYQPKYWNLRFPRFSTLMQTEQIQYVQLFRKYSAMIPPQPTPTEAKEIQQLRELHVKVSAEQSDFLSWLANVSAPQSAEDYDFISPQAQRYVEAMLKARKRHLQQYPRYYVQCDTVDLRPPKDVSTATFTHLASLLQVGQLSKTSLPIVEGTSQSVHLDHTGFNSSSNKPHFQMAASRDSVMAGLAASHAGSVTLTSSSWKRLVDNVAPQFGTQWELPVVIREEVDSGGVRRRVVHVDKPFAPKVWPIRERNASYYRLSFRLWLSRTSRRLTKPQARRKTKKANKRAPKPADHIPFNKFETLQRVDLASFETFGCAPPTMNKRVIDRGRDGPTDNGGRGSRVIDRDNESGSSTERSGASSSDDSVEEFDSNNEESCLQIDDNRLPLSEQLDGTTGKRGRGRGQGRGRGWGKGRGSKQAAAAAVPVAAARKSPRRSSTLGSSVIRAEIDNSDDGVVTKIRRISRINNASSQSGNVQSNDVLASSAANVPLEISVTCVKPTSDASKCVNTMLPTTVIVPVVSQQDIVSTIDTEAGAAATVAAVPDVTQQQPVPAAVPVTPVQHTCHQCPPADRRVTYDLWSLNDLHLVIRHSETFSAEDSDEQVSPIYPVIKLEYQLKYGVEQMAASEVAQSWAALCIRRDCRLTRARVNAFNGKVVMAENLSLEQIVPQRGLFQTNVALLSVYNMLKKLCQLPLGHYLLSHNAGNPVVHIKRATDTTSGVYDLHLAHSEAPAAKCVSLPDIPWVPVDPTIVLPYHLINGRIPATFCPKGKPQAPASAKKWNKKNKFYKNNKRSNK